jgi:hypothetical protein
MFFFIPFFTQVSQVDGASIQEYLSHGEAMLDPATKMTYLASFVSGQFLPHF